MTRPPITLTIRYRAQTLCELVRTYYVDVIPGGLIVRTCWQRVPLVRGARVRLRVLLGDGNLVASGEAEVAWLRGRRTSDGRDITVLGLRFAGLCAAGRHVYAALIEHGRRLRASELAGLRATMLGDAARTRRVTFGAPTRVTGL